MNKIASSAKIMNDVILGDNVVIEDDVYIDHQCIVRDNVHLKKGCTIGAGCILGEYLVDFYDDRINKVHPLIIGEHALIRSGTIIYGDTEIGDDFQTGHRVTIRERAEIGHHVRIGTLSDIQGHCRIGNYVNMHSNVHVGHKSEIEDFVWLFPYVILTNDPTPPSEELVGVKIRKFAVVSTGSILLPGVEIGEDALVGAGANVTKNIEAGMIALGNPAKVVGPVTKIKNKVTGESVYPWRYHFDRGMPWHGYRGELTQERIEEMIKNGSGGGVI